ncbi:cytochrome P450 85A-like [Tripterygium wilfordii]|uniref:cytochrome P450 85A-like n=1 Tax=Tripterygium wilfordii TaxID=458696 RepID=UPI0018F83FC6|nr:cytochrome P450 85A-like [Tripterygium wilfordii]
MAAGLVVIAAWLLFICICVYFGLLKWNQIRYGRKGLPPGTMGLPIVGQNTSFLKYGPDFMKNQRARHGSVFKTHVMGSPTVICMNPELNRYILLNEGKGMVPGYPTSMVDILGRLNIAAVHGSDHKRVRGSLLSLIGPPLIKDQLFAKIDHFMSSFLQHWDGQTIDIQEKASEMAFLISLKETMENESKFLNESFKQEFDKLVIGTISLPVNFPGTNYRRGLEGRKRVVTVLKQIMKERRASGITCNDMLDKLLRNEDPKYRLSDDEIIDQLIVILHSGYETVSKTTMMAIKYLHDNPRALQQLREEHLAIRETKKPGESIDWNDYKSMTFTRAVIIETSRLATVVNGVLRRTTKDVELNGYIIPKGWKIYVFTGEINYDPNLYPEPLTFNPWRWLDKGLESHNYFFLFGGGSRLCPGKELGIVYISMFLHYFATRYRWEIFGSDEIVKFPRVEAPNGLHITISNYQMFWGLVAKGTRATDQLCKKVERQPQVRPVSTELLTFVL